MADSYKPLKIRKLADTSVGERLVRLLVPADRITVDGDDRAVIDPADVEQILWNPATPENEHEPWPLAGVRFEGDAPHRTKIPTRFVTRGVNEGWIELVGERVEHAPGGPAEEPWRVTHTFVHADALVFKFVGGDVRYRVTAQPGKYDDPSEPAGARVDWFYSCVREDGE